MWGPQTGRWVWGDGASPSGQLRPSSVSAALRPKLAVHRMGTLLRVMPTPHSAHSTQQLWGSSALPVLGCEVMSVPRGALALQSPADAGSRAYFFVFCFLKFIPVKAPALPSSQSLGCSLCSDPCPCPWHPPHLVLCFAPWSPISLVQPARVGTLMVVLAV